MTNHTKVFKHQTTTEQTFQFQYDSKRNYKAVHVKGDASWDALPVKVQETALSFLHRAHRFNKPDGYTETCKVLVPTTVEYEFKYLEEGVHQPSCVQVRTDWMHWYMYHKGEPGSDLPDEVVQAARDFLRDCMVQDALDTAARYTSQVRKTASQMYWANLEARALVEAGIVYLPCIDTYTTPEAFRKDFGWVPDVPFWSCRCVVVPPCIRDYLKDRSWTK